VSRQQQHKDVGDLRLLRRVFKESRGFRLKIVGVFALSLLETPLFLLTPVPLAIAVDSFSKFSLSCWSMCKRSQLRSRRPRRANA
jgi:hypothetical protein